MKVVMHRALTKEKGNVSELISTCLCLLMITVLVMAYMKNVSLLQQKSKINQISRKYILEMESRGYLEAEREVELLYELETIGAKDVSLEGTTRTEVEYGDAIYLSISGKLGEEYAFNEKRTSTSKN